VTTLWETIEGSQKIDKFIRSRRSPETREYARAIIDLLYRARGWVNLRDLQRILLPDEIPSESAFFRLLSDMEKDRIVDKDKIQIAGRPGRPPTRYKLFLFTDDSLPPDRLGTEPPQLSDTDKRRLMIEELETVIEGLKRKEEDENQKLLIEHFDAVVKALKADMSIPEHQDTIPPADVKKAVTPSHSVKYREADGNIWEMYTRPDGKKGKRLIKSAPATKPKAEIEGLKKKATRRI
jgi:hypothetical protein